MAKLRIEWRWLEMIRKPKKGKAGYYEWIDSAIVLFLERQMGKTTFKAKKEQGLENYDRSTAKFDVESSELIPEIQDALKEIKDQRSER